MRQSEQINELAAAFSKAQGAFPPVRKERTARIESAKGGYSYAYADLADIFDAIRQALANNGLSVIQPTSIVGDGVVIVTRLMHSSGQWIESDFPFETYDRPQETGSALTYARRYALGSFLGIAAEEDDDGASAQQSTPRPKSEPPANAPKCPKCGKPGRKDKDGAGYYCWKAKGGCGNNWTPGAETAPPAPTPGEPSSSGKCPSCGSQFVGVSQTTGDHYCRECGTGWK